MLIQRSTKKDKKFMVRSPSGKLVHFAQKGYGDFHLWQLARGMKFALKKRSRYIKSHKAILLKDGTPAYKNPESPEFYSIRATWELKKGDPLFKQVVAIRNKGLSASEKAFIKKQKKLKK